MGRGPLAVMISAICAARLWRKLCCALFLCLAASPPVRADAPDQERLRIAFWRIDLGARGPGYALRDIAAAAPRAVATADVIAHLEPDVLVLSGLDYDLGLHTLAAFRDLVTARGHAMAHILAFPTNAGLRTGQDMTGDGRADTPDDTHGYGRFAGERALALMSRLPVDRAGARDFSHFLWRDLPDARLPALGPHVLALQRLSSTGHWDIPLVLGPELSLHLLVYQAGPPVFGRNPERNLLRNHDETAFWTAYLDGRLPMAPPQGPLVLVGGSNLDPADGDGLHKAMRALLAHPALQDPAPTSAGALLAASDPISARHLGPHDQDTVFWPDGPGHLRVSYILPGAALRVLDAGVFWPLPDTPEAALFGPADALYTPHRPVWVDIDRRSVTTPELPN